MLSIQKKPNYFERVIRLDNGSFALVRFEIVEVDGVLKARAVCGKILGETIEQKIYSLPSHVDSFSIIPLKKSLTFYNELISNDLSFTTVQCTRAPNFA